MMSFETGCDISGEVVMTKTLGAMTDTGGVISCLMGCDIINTVVWCDRIDVMSSAVQRMSHICRLWDYQHRVF